jgi:membrane fusion protein, copper/silver efflux system
MSHGRRRRRTTMLLLVALALGASGVWLARSQPAPAGAAEAHAEGTASQTWYTCGMHPEVVQDHPGSCPKCGMRLQPMAHDRAVAMGLVAASAGDPASPAGERKILFWKSSMIPGEIHQEPGKDSMGMDLVPVFADEAGEVGLIRIDPVTEQNMGVRVAPVVRGPLVQSVRTVGMVDYDETTLAAVSLKVDGWVEKLYVDKTGAQVHTGDPLFELYSPALFSAQQEYLAALRNLQEKDVPAIPGARMDSESLVRDARTRLEYFDISDAQIREIERSGTGHKTLTIRAPFTGIVTHKNVVEGQMIKAGTDVFRIADLSTVWVIGKVFEQDLAYVDVGQEALMTLSYLPGRTFRGRVTYVYPYLEEKTREVPIRMEFHNPGYELKPGMYATVTLSHTVPGEATLVPDVAVIDTGLRKVVFVMRAPGRYEAREVKTGLRSENDRLEVLSGVTPGEQVVISGQFLLDSESRLREAALKLLEPGVGESATPIKDVTRTAEEAAAEAEGPGAEPKHGGTLAYVCPMPEHADIFYDKPGTCPLCGMKLVPVERWKGHVESPRIAYWTCPMPEHASVHEPGPGTCPICGMSLVPVTEDEASARQAAPSPSAAPGAH